MVTSFHAQISRILNIPAGQVERTIGLLGEGATIPFISRYRKEVTGGLDEVQIGNIKDQLDKLTELKKRKESILSSIEEQGKLTPELKKRIEGLGFINHGVNERTNLVVLNRTQMPALLIEAGFINNDSDNALFDNRFDELAQAIADGILDSLP